MHDWSDEQALTYDQQWGALTFHTQIPSLARVEAGNRIVELGCGGGYLSLCLAKFAPEVKVLGLDPTAKMIKLAQNRRQEAGVDATHLTFLQVAAEELEVQPDSLDLAIAAFSVHHWQEPKLGMSLVYQGLKPGGRIWLCEDLSVPLIDGVAVADMQVDTSLKAFEGLQALLHRAGFIEIKHSVNSDFDGEFLIVEATKQ